VGGIKDAFPEFATNLLETLALAVRCRRYVAMVGQGFGPLQTPGLVARACAVLLHINFIGTQANGIPTIGLAKSTYYIDKFMGLSALFGPGSETVLLEKRNFAQH
jgi:hypothetical protein